MKQPPTTLVQPTDSQRTTPTSDTLGLNWLIKQSAPERWAMDRSTLACLLSCTTETLSLWLKNADTTNSLRLPTDTQERIGCLFRLDCILSIVMPAELRFSAFCQPTAQDSLFSGLSMRDYLLAEPTTSRFYKLCDYLQGHVVLGRSLSQQLLR